MKYLLFIFAFLFSISSFSQNGDDGWNDRELPAYANDDEPARVSITLKAGFDTQGHDNFRAYIDPDLPLNGGIPVNDGQFNMNYIRQYIPIRDNATTTIPIHEGLEYSDWAETITYFDGLGRPIQNIAVKGTAAGTDLIQPIVYDDYGRIKEEYLPYAIAQLSGGGSPGDPGYPGGYRPIFLPEQKAFYGIYNPGEEDFTFANKEFDGSPLNRVMKQAAQGYDWRMDGGHEMEFEYKANSITSEVVLYEINGDNLIKSNNPYVENTLYKNIFFDENQNQVIEYKDKQGKVVLKKSYDDLHWLYTYYIYDDFSLLRYVLPPKASDALTGSSGNLGDYLSNQTINELCYYYEYDDRHLMIKKKLPGAEIVYLVYNKRDQLVLTQDGNLRIDMDWLFTKYDVFNRPIMTGKYHHHEIKSQEEMQSDVVDNNTHYFEEVILSPPHGYSNQAFPSINSTGCEVYTITYYDNYEYINLGFGPDYSFDFNQITFLHLDDNDLPPDIVKGQVTAVKTKILTNTEIQVGMDYLKSVNYYDKYFRIVQSISDNHLGGIDIVSNQINFTGDVMLTKENHNDGSVIVQTEYEYDDGKRLIKTKHKINDENQVTLNHTNYDELGRVRRKNLHASNTNSLQTINYKYNIREWLTDINDVDNLESDLFAMHLGYTSIDYPDPQYNGNIASMQWNTEMFGSKTYNFDYDGINRLTNADFSAIVGNYQTDYSYDLNGNILTLNRVGKLGSGGFGPIDELVYSYVGNQLNSVNDDPYIHYQDNGFSDNGSINGSNEYAYDANGNMNSDDNKDMNVIEYNYLNLPQQITINSDNNSNAVNYLYDAMGNKLRKQTKINGTTETVTDYIGSFVYEDEGTFELRYILTTEGRIMANPDGSFNYQYVLKDHLGNTRVTFDQSGQTIQEDSYYPFGMAMNGLNYQSGTAYQNKYLYNGKELQDEFGLGWYDYGARMYDAEIGRWNGLDPYSDIYENLSPYNYAINSPINVIDPDGRLVVYVNGFRQEAYQNWLLSVDPLFVPAPHEWNFPNWYNDDQFNYWNKFRENWDFEVNGESNFFVDGSNHARSSAVTRFSKGETEGKLLAEKIKNGEITLQDGEFIKLIGHSMGAAHAVGMAQGLINGGIDPKLLKVFLFAPHQPNQIVGVDGVEIFQAGRDGDKVSSVGFLPFVTESKHDRVPGADWVVVPDREEEEYGGHYVQTFTASEFKKAAPVLYQYLINAGYINPDGTLK